MKIYFIFSLLLSVLCEGMILSVDQSLEVLSKAFENVTRHLFQLETRMFINNYGVDLDTITSLFLNNLNENEMPFQLKNLQLEKEKILLDSSALLTFNNFALVKEFNQKLKLTNEFFKPLQLFVYCRKSTISDIESLELDVTKRAKSNKITVDSIYGVSQLNSYLVDIIQYEYFLVDETNYIKLLTFVWFSSGKCGELQLIELNNYNKITRRWENDKFSMRKSANLHGCTIFEALVMHDMTTLTQPGNDFTETRQVLNNATIITIFFNNSDIFFERGCYDAFDRYRITQNGSRKSVDIDFITYPLENIISRLVADIEIELYSEYDKLVMPFDEFTWAMIAITFAIAFATILILYCCVKKSIRDFIIGPNIDTPWLNVIQIFFGISQVVMPRRNFARFLTMVFILYCLIIRTAWQGKTFEFMQKDIEKPVEHTIDGLIEKGYTFVMEENYKEKFPESAISKRGKVEPILGKSETFELEKGLKKVEPKKEVIQINPCLFQVMLNLKEDRTEVIEMQKDFAKRMVRHYSQTKICGLKFARHHYLFETIDHKMKQHFVGGIVMHTKFGRSCGSLPWADLKEKRFKSVEDAKVLNMKMLEPGFVIWTSSLLFAVAAFIFEWTTVLKDFLVVKYILHAYYVSRH